MSSLAREAASSIADQGVRERVQASLLKYDRFRQKVVEDAMGATWVDDAAFDLAHHVVAEAAQHRRQLIQLRLIARLRARGRRRPRPPL